jgi:hypothetical protein
MDFLLNLIPKSKKARALISQKIIILVGAILAYWQIDMTPQMELIVAAVVGLLLTWAQAAYTKSQGIADAGSNGKTSANYTAPIDVTVGELTKVAEALGMELRKKRKTPTRQPKKPKDEPPEDAPGDTGRTGKWARNEEPE